MASRPPHVDAAPAPVKLPRGPGRLADPELQRQAREKSAQVRAARASARLNPVLIAEESLMGLLALRRECRALLAANDQNTKDRLELVRLTLQVESEIADRTAGRPPVAKPTGATGPAAYADELRRLDDAGMTDLADGMTRPDGAPDASSVTSGVIRDASYAARSTSADAPDAPTAPRPMRTLRPTRPARRNKIARRRRAT